MPLQLDTSGTATANRVNGEVIAVTPTLLNTFGCIYPDQGPFFGQDFTVTYTPTSPPSSPAQALVLGEDYDFMFELPGFGDTAQEKVWGAISLFDLGLNGNITVSYQALGGLWTLDKALIRTYLNSTQFNSNVQLMALVPAEPLYLPSNPGVVWPLNSTQSITIAQAQVPGGITLSVEFLLIDGNDNENQYVIVLETPLPPNAAKENGGHLATVAGAQGAGGSSINQPTGGSGILGWLSGIYQSAVTLIASAATIITRLNSPFAATQSGSWNVGVNQSELADGPNIIGATVEAALSVISDSTTTSGETYVCEAEPGASAAVAVWRIRRITTATGRVMWASGTGAFDKIAADRATYTYS